MQSKGGRKEQSHKNSIHDKPQLLLKRKETGSLFEHAAPLLPNRTPLTGQTGS